MTRLIKHYTSTMKGIPQLSNNWGAMITILDAILVNGFNYVPISSLTKSTQTGLTATINLGADHGFIDRQIIRVAGSTNGWNGDYKVLSADSNSITVECPATHPQTITGLATCLTAPLDFEIVHQTPIDSPNPKRAYRSKDPESLGLILLVHDFCVSGASATGAKFAKVGIVENMQGIDVIMGNQMPFDVDNINANWAWDGTYHGWSKWYYRTKNNSSPNDYGADNIAAIAGTSAFHLVGDSCSFMFDVAHSNLGGVAVYGVCEFFDHELNGNNLALLAFGSQVKVPQSFQYLYGWARGSYILCNEAESQAVGGAGLKINALIWFDRQGLAEYQTAGVNMLIGSVQQDNPFNAVNYKLLFGLPICDSTNTPRGVLPFLRISASQVNEVSVSTSVGKYLNRYHHAATLKVVKYALLMESY